MRLGTVSGDMAPRACTHTMCQPRCWCFGSHRVCRQCTGCSLGTVASLLGENRGACAHTPCSVCTVQRVWGCAPPSLRVLPRLAGLASTEGLCVASRARADTPACPARWDGDLRLVSGPVSWPWHRGRCPHPEVELRRWGGRGRRLAHRWAIVSFIARLSITRGLPRRAGLSPPCAAFALR